MRRPLRALNDKRGLTLIEVLVSLVIVFIVFIGLSSSGLLVLDYNIRNSLRDEAVSIAEQEVQDARALAFGNLLDNTHTVSRKIRNLDKTFTVTRSVIDLDGQNKQMQITVAWNHLTRVGESWVNRTESHRVFTIVRQ